jgi:cytochrome c-type biogenesis protein CcsB
MSTLFLRLAITFYALGLLHSLLTILSQRRRIFRVALAGITAGFICHALAISWLWYEVAHPPITNLQEALSFFAFAIVLAYLFTYWRYHLSALSVFIFPLVFILTLAANLMSPGEHFRSDILKSLWFYMHIPSTFLAYAAFFVAFVAGVMYLVQEKELKRKRPQLFYYRLPSLEICDQMGVRALSFGFPLLTIGIIAGVLWAKSAAIKSWETDPKIIFAFITWLFYAIVLYFRRPAGQHARIASMLSIAAFLFVLLNFVILRNHGLAHRFILP